MTTRFILRAASSAAFPSGDDLASRLQDRCGVQVLDRSPRMLLVAGTHSELAAVLEGCSGWSLIPETTTALPDPRPRVGRRPPGS